MHIILLYICGASGSLALASSLKNVYNARAIQSGRVQYNGGVGNSNETSVVFCVEVCAKHTKCMTFFYNKSTKECILHSKTFHYQVPDILKEGWTMYLLTDCRSRCPSKISEFVYYRDLDICYNFNPEHTIDYSGNVLPTCSSYGAELLRIDSQERQTYFEHVLVGRPTVRVAIQGHNFNAGNQWTLFDSTPLPYIHWGSGHPLSGQWYLQMFTGDFWTEKIDVSITQTHIFLCERR